MKALWTSVLYRCLVCVFFWTFILSALAASDTDQVLAAPETLPSPEQCVISNDAEDAISRAAEIYEATEMYALDKTIYPTVLDLIEEAKRAASFPECDSVRAKILAEKAIRLVYPDVEEKIYPDFQEHGSSAEQYKPRRKPIPNFCDDLFEGGGAPPPEPIVAIISTTKVLVSTTTLCVPTATTNAIRGTDDLAYYRLKRYRFVAQTPDRLATDFSAGGGEFADALAFLFGCPRDSRAQYIDLVRQNFDRIFTAGEPDPAVILDRLEAEIVQHPDLSVECTRVS